MQQEPIVLSDEEIFKVWVCNFKKQLIPMYEMYVIQTHINSITEKTEMGSFTDFCYNVYTENTHLINESIN